MPEYRGDQAEIQTVKSLKWPRLRSRHAPDASPDFFIVQTNFRIHLSPAQQKIKIVCFRLNFITLSRGE